MRAGESLVTTDLERERERERERESELEREEKKKKKSETTRWGNRTGAGPPASDGGKPHGEPPRFFDFISIQKSG